MVQLDNFDFEIDLLLEENLYLIENFQCGNKEIDKYVREKAFLESNNGKGVTYIITNDKRDKLIAYFTLLSTSLIYCMENNTEDESNTDDIKLRGVPSIEVKMFAVHNDYQDTIYDSKLISDRTLEALINIAYTIALENVGAEMIVLHSTPNAVRFYQRNNFKDLEYYMKPLYNSFNDGCIPMYLRLFE